MGISYNKYVKDFEIILICICVAIALILFLYIYLKCYKGHNRFILFLRYKIFRIKDKKKKYDAYYSIKPRYVSPSEQEYLNLIKSILRPEFIIFPQVPLSQIVEKHSPSNYKNELFRVVDFCVFDTDYYPILCIEINDNTHLNKDRVQRDSKVSAILKSARLPLVTLWTYEGASIEKIKKALKPYGVV
jgi:hypothetical protein